MDLFQASLLGALQGLTEFLPVSSSGHLVLAQFLLNLPAPPVYFDVLVHVATLAVVLVFFRVKMGELLKDTVTAVTSLSLKRAPAELGYIVLGTIPVALMGLVLNSYTLQLFLLSPLLVVGFTITTIILGSSYFVRGQNNDLMWVTVLVIGLFQALAILPGVSRSGLTIVAALWLGVRREKAFEFSFLLLIPAVIGAIALQLDEIGRGQFFLLSNWVGLAVATVVGYLSLKLLQGFVINRRLYLFSLYTLLLTVLTYLLL